MTTGEAIQQLRQTLGKLQEEFASMVGTSGATVSRWENGRQPTRHYLRKLAEVAKAAGEDHLAMFFAAARQANFIAKVKNLPSPNSSRRISLQELKAWMESLQAISQTVKAVLDGKVDPLSDEGRTLLVAMLSWSGGTAAELNQYIDPPKRVIWEELDPVTQAAILGPSDPEKTKAGIQAMQRRHDESWGRPSQEKPAAEPKVDTESDSGDGSTDH